MLRIRKSQMAVFEEDRLDRFAQEALEKARPHWAHKIDALGEDEALAMVRRALDRGMEFGFDTQRLALRWLNVVFALSEGFDERYPWAQRVLDQDKLPPNPKLAILIEKTGAYLNDEHPE